MGLHIVITGNPVDGFEYYGLFTTANDANDWADKNLHHHLGLDWWVAPLLEPTEED